LQEAVPFGSGPVPSFAPFGSVADCWLLEAPVLPLCAVPSFARFGSVADCWLLEAEVLPLAGWEPSLREIFGVEASFFVGTVVELDTGPESPSMAVGKAMDR